MSDLRLEAELFLKHFRGESQKLTADRVNDKIHGYILLSVISKYSSRCEALPERRGFPFR